MNYDDDIPSWNEVAQFRYDTRYPNATVVDVTVVDNNLSRVLVLEKIDNDDDTYDTRAYHVDLSNMDMWYYWNVSNCFSLSPDNCTNFNMTLNHTLTSNFAYDINKTIPSITDVHVDAISFTGNGIGCGDGYYFMLGASDNQETEDTYIIFFCFHPFSAHDHGHGDGDNSTHHMHSTDDGGHHHHGTETTDDGGHHHHDTTQGEDETTDVGGEESDNSSFIKLNLFVNSLCLFMFSKLFLAL